MGQWGYSEIFLHVENDNVRQIYSNYGSAFLPAAVTFLVTQKRQVQRDLAAADMVAAQRSQQGALQDVLVVRDAKQHEQVVVPYEGEDRRLKKNGWIIMHKSLS